MICPVMTFGSFREHSHSIPHPLPQRAGAGVVAAGVGLDAAGAGPEEWADVATSRHIRLRSAYARRILGAILFVSFVLFVVEEFVPGLRL